MLLLLLYDTNWLEEQKIQQVWCTERAFLVLLDTGRIVAWGNRAGADRELKPEIKAQLEEVGIALKPSLDPAV